MTDTIKRNANYFEDILSKKDKSIYANDIDVQFNEIANYLEDILKPAIDALVNKSVEGVAGYRNTFLRNIGDGATDWANAKEGLDDYSIDLTKLVKKNIGSVVITDADGNLDVIAPSSNEEILISRNDDVPVWQLVKSENIDFKTLTGEQFGELQAENFVADLFDLNIESSVIASKNIQDLSITNDKLENNSVPISSLGIFSNLPAVTTGFTVEHIADGAITADKIQDRTIPVYYYIQGNNTRYETMMDMWSAYDNIIQQPNGKHVWKKILPQRAILDNSIDDSKLHPFTMAQLRSGPNLREGAAPALFDYYGVPQAFQFQSNHITNNTIEMTHFDDEIQEAINRL